MTASAGAIQAGRATIEIVISDKLQKGLSEASAKLKAFGAGVATIGAGITAVGSAFAGPILASAKAFSTVGDDIEKMGRRTGLAAESVSELKFAAAQSGTEISAVEIAVRKMQKTITDASDGTKEAVDGLKRLGLTVADLKDMNPAEQFALIARRMAAIPNATTKAASAMEVFGKSGTAIIPMIEDLDALQKEARELGIVMSTEDATAAANLNDAFGRLTAQFEAIKNIVGAAVTPLLLEMAETLKETAKDVIQWVNNNRELMQSILKLSAVITAAGIIITALGVAIMGLGSVISNLKIVLPVMASVVNSFASLYPVVISSVNSMMTMSWTVVDTTANLGKMDAAMTALGQVTRGVGIAAVAVGVAIAGWNIGKWIAEVTGLNNAIQEFYNQMVEVRDMRGDSFEFASQIAYINKEFYAGRISGEKYKKMMADIAAISKGTYAPKVQEDRSAALIEEEKKRVSDRVSFEKRMIDELQNARNANIDDEYNRAVDSAKNRYAIEMAEAKKLGAETASIQAIFTEKMINASKAKNKQEAEFSYAIFRRYNDLENQIMQEGLDKEINAIENRYKEEMRLAAGNASRMSDLRAIEAEEIRVATELDRRRREETAKTVNTANENDIADLMLEAAYKGYELEKKKLDLARERALTEAKAAGANTDLVNKEFDLQQQIMDAAEEAKNNSITVAGAFNAVEAAGIAAGTSKEAERTAKATEKTVDILRKIEKKTGVPVSIVS